MAMGKQRGLAAGEIALAREAFGSKIDYGKVKLSDGPGNQPLAHAAFAKGNPAITVGSTVYFKVHYCADFSAAGADKSSFMHEMAHVWQYQKLGLLAFFVRYGAEFARVGGNPNDMYLYKKGTDAFGQAMLEAQAQMVGDYAVASAADKAELRKNLAGSGLYGF
jgi:hypothetical protein